MFGCISFFNQNKVHIYKEHLAIIFSFLRTFDCEDKIILLIAYEITYTKKFHMQHEDI